MTDTHRANRISGNDPERLLIDRTECEEQRGIALLLAVGLTSVTVELNFRESGALFPCKWSSVCEIYRKPCWKNFIIMPR